MDKLQNIENLLTENMKKVLIGALIFIFVVGLGVFIFRISDTNQKYKSVTSASLPEGYKYNVMKADKYPEGFPSEVIVRDGNPLWQRGEDTVVGTGERQRIVELLYTIDSVTLGALYETNMVKDGWKSISDEVMKEAGIHFFTKKADTFTISIVPKDTGSFVNLKYLAK